MERNTGARWREAREHHRRLLFGESLEIAPAMGNVAVAPLTVLTHYTRTQGTATPAERIAQAEITEAAHEILEYHDKRAATSKNVLFGIVDPNDVPYIADLTAEVIKRWERACRRQGRDSPFADLVTSDIINSDLKRQDVQLLIETASAVIEVLQLGYCVNRNVGSHACKLLINFLARRGPHFAEAWLRGDIIRNYCSTRGEDSEEILSLVPKGRLAYYALNNPADPLKAVLSYAEMITSTLAPKELAPLVGWNLARTESIFSHNTRVLVAQRWTSDPQEGAKQMAAHLDTTLTNANLSEITGETPAYLDDLFHLADRIRLATTKDPIAHVKSRIANFKALTTSGIAAKVGWSEAEVKVLFTPGNCRKLAASENLEDRLNTLATIFKETLSIDNIAHYLDWDKPQTRQVFTDYIRRLITFDNAESPLRRVREVAIIRSKLIKDYKLPLALINTLSAKYRYKLARQAADRVQKELAHCPPHVGTNTWMWLIAQDPTASRERLLRRAAACNLYLDMKYARWNKVSAKEATLQEAISEPSINFLNDTFLEEPELHLQKLATQANISHQELDELLQDSNRAKETTAPKRQEILERLWGAAQEEGS